MIRKWFVFIQRMLLAISAVLVVNPIVYAKGNDMGKLLFSGGQNQLFEFEGRSVLELAKIKNNDKYKANYINLEKVDGDRFLFETPSNEVGIYSLETLQEKIMFENSSCPIYFEDTGEILFSKVEETGGGFEEFLYLSDLGGTNPLVLKKIARGSASKCPIKLNGYEALVFLSYGINKHVAVFNVKDRTFIEKKYLCDPIFGLGDNKLLCLKDKSYFISDYDGNKLRDIDSRFLNKNNMFPVISINETNSILIQEYRERLFRSPVVNLWVFDLATFQKSLVVKNVVVEKKGAIYLSY